jgi:hypothetical protein
MQIAVRVPLESHRESNVVRILRGLKKDLSRSMVAMKMVAFKSHVTTVLVDFYQLSRLELEVSARRMWNVNVSSRVVFSSDSAWTTLLLHIDFIL